VIQSNKLPERRGAFRAYLAIGLAIIGAGYLYRAELVLALSSLEVIVGTLGPLAPIAMCIISGAWATLCLPGPLMLGLVGTMFSAEPFIGLLVVLAGDTIATIIGFQVARSAGRDKVREWLQEKSWFEWLERHTKSRGLYGVFFLRMMPFFPNSLANYALGLTALRFWPYLLASVLGSIPNLALYIFGTAGTISLLREGFASPASFAKALLLLILVALLVKGFQSLLKRRASALEESDAKRR
jgi:uncharacterized membrane protein YdjX (TVP38/TMEM64 family)